MLLELRRDLLLVVFVFEREQNHESFLNLTMAHMLGAVVLDCHVEDDDVLIVVALLAQLPCRVSQLRVHVFDAQVGEPLPVVDAHLSRFCGKL